MLKPIEFTDIKEIMWEDWREDCEKRLKFAASLDIPHMPILQPHEGKCAIVGAGATVEDYVENIKAIKRGEFNIVMSINGIHDWLIKRDIIPNIHVILEYDHAVEYGLGGLPHKDVVYYVASVLTPSHYEYLEGHKMVLFHTFISPAEYVDWILKYFPGEYMVCGGCTTLFRSLAIAVFLGYRNFELFGCDGSFTESDHIEGYKVADIEKRLKLYGKHGETGEVKEFTTNANLAYQATQFLEFCEARKGELNIKINGNGLLRYLHESRYPDQYKE